MMAPAVGAALAAMRKPDPEFLREAMGDADTLLESVLPLLERAAEGVLLTLPDERVVFYVCMFWQLPGEAKFISR